MEEVKGSLPWDQGHQLFGLHGSALSETLMMGPNLDKRTLIPKPTQRASSFDREKKPSVHRSGSLDRAMGHLMLSSNKGSQKNKNTYATPQQTPSYLPPMSSVSSSRDEEELKTTLSTSGQVLNSNLPIIGNIVYCNSDAFDHAATEAGAHLIHNYFTQKLNLVEPLSKGFNQRTITIKMFVDMMSQLLHFYFPKCIINTSNYTEEIPRLMKKLVYPYNVNKSWLVTVNAPCSWPQVLGILTWLIDLQEDSVESTMDMAFPDDEDGTEEVISDRELLVHYFETYNLWRAQQDDDVEVACAQLEQKMMDKVGFSEAEEQKCLEDIRRLQEKLNDPEILKEEKEIEVLSKTSADLQDNIKVLSDYIAKLEAYINDFEIFKHDMEEKNQSLVESIASKEKILEDLKCQCENQIISMDEKNRIDEESAGLKQEIENMNTYRDTLNNQLYSDDIKISQLKDKWNKSVVEYNKRILNMSIQFPELQQFIVETKFTQPESMKNFDTKLYELEKQLNNEQEVLKNELKVLKQKKDLVIQSNQEKANEVKKLKAQQKKLKDTLNNLKADISKEEAEHELLSQNIVKKIKRLMDEAEDLISKEESARAEYQQEMEKLEQISSELKEMDESAKQFFTKIFQMAEFYVLKMKLICFSYSCGYQKAFQEYHTILQQKYPEIIVEGENYNPPGLSMIIAKALGVIKMALIVCIVSGVNILQYTGIPLQSWWSWCVDNKLYSCMMVFFLSNALEGQLVSTGAFEISFNDMPVWSKLETGRIPQPPELFQIIDNNLQFQTTVELKPGFAK
uniref:Kinetochore protein NDC80 n=1 Tax=Timema bartmani TaxID=61472 RepID=A0A7R9HXX0_9NEOP|nr:unnamed protein product [Timema bartmani]